MCRLLGYCSHDAASVGELLGTESFRAFTSLSDLHGDGWGMAWYAGSRPAAWKSAARAGSLGFLAAGYKQPEVLAEQIRSVREVAGLRISKTVTG